MERKRKQMNLTLDDQTREILVKIAKANRIPISRAIDFIVRDGESIETLVKRVLKGTSRKSLKEKEK